MLFWECTYEDELEIAREEAMEKGLEKGLEKGRIEIAKSLLQAKMDVNFVAKHTGLSEEEIQKLK